MKDVSYEKKVTCHPCLHTQIWSLNLAILSWFNCLNLVFCRWGMAKVLKLVVQSHLTSKTKRELTEHFHSLVNGFTFSFNQTGWCSCMFDPIYSFINLLVSVKCCNSLVQINLWGPRIMQPDISCNSVSPRTFNSTNKCFIKVCPLFS